MNEYVFNQEQFEQLTKKVREAIGEAIGRPITYGIQCEDRDSYTNKISSPRIETGVLPKDKIRENFRKSIDDAMEVVNEKMSDESINKIHNSFTYNLPRYVDHVDGADRDPIKKEIFEKKKEVIEKETFEVKNPIDFELDFDVD